MTRPPSRARADELAQVGEVRGARRRGAASSSPHAPGSALASSSPTSVAEVRAQPRRRRELHGVRDLVDHHPREQVLERRRRGARRVSRRFGATSSSRGGGRLARSSSATSYCPSTRRPMYPMSAPISAPTAPPATERTAPGQLRRALVERLGRAGRSSRAAGRRSTSDPRAAPDAPRATGSGVWRLEPACRRRRPPAPAGRAPARSPGSGGAGAPPVAGDRAADRAGELPGDHRSTGQASRPARGRRACGRRRPASARSRSASGAPSGSASDGNATSAAGLADDQLRRGGVDRAAAAAARPSRRRGRRRPGRARSRSSRSRARGARSASQRVGTARGEPARCGGLDRRRPPAARPRVRRSAGSVAERRRRRATRRRRARARHSSAVPDVVDVAEAHVGHRRAVGDGDRQRVVGEAALGVQRAVDRVDHDEHAGIAEVDDPALLGDGGEARARVVEPLQLGEDDVLGGAGRSRASDRRPRRSRPSRSRARGSWARRRAARADPPPNVGRRQPVMTEENGG